MMPLILVSTVCLILLATTLRVLESGYIYRILRRLWSKNQRERLISFAEEFPIAPSGLLFIGDTHIADFRWEDHLRSTSIRNLGVPNETVNELNQRLDLMLECSPKAILLHSGGTDVQLGYRTTKIIAELERVLLRIQHSSPCTTIAILAVLPQRPAQTAKIRRINLWLREFATQNGYLFIDAYDNLADSSGGLGEDFSADHYHLWGGGYEVLLSKVELALNTQNGIN